MNVLYMGNEDILIVKHEDTFYLVNLDYNRVIEAAPKNSPAMFERFIQLKEPVVSKERSELAYSLVEKFIKEKT